MAKRLSKRQRVNLIKDLTSERYSKAELARKYRVTRNTVEYWAKPVAKQRKPPEVREFVGDASIRPKEEPRVPLREPESPPKEFLEPEGTPIPPEVDLEALEGSTDLDFLLRVRDDPEVPMGVRVNAASIRSRLLAKGSEEGDWTPPADEGLWAEMLADLVMSQPEGVKDKVFDLLKGLGLEGSLR